MSRTGGMSIADKKSKKLQGLADGMGMVIKVLLKSQI
jgi:hypothetical protein